MNRIILFTAFALAAIIVGALTVQWYGIDRKFAYEGHFSLTDQTGKPVNEEIFNGKPSVVFFGFTHCPEVCPTTLFELDGWLTALGDQGKDIQAYFVTVDPERDTAQMLNGYISNVSKRIIGITGDPSEIKKINKSFGIFSEKVPNGDDDYTINHTASIFLLNANGQLAGTISYGENPDTAKAKLERLAKG